MTDVWQRYYAGVPIKYETHGGEDVCLISTYNFQLNVNMKMKIWKYGNLNESFKQSDEIGANYSISKCL